MVKLIIAFISIAVALFGSSQSASFQCKYTTGSWGILGTIYYCVVINDAGITSLDAAKVDDISGAHLAGQNDDNVVSFHDVGKGKIHYFPRGLNKVFKNLRGIHIVNSGLKEIHKSDLKPFSKLTSLYLNNNQLEVLEENLFEFNPNLDFIYLKSNKISHIDSNVFDKLTKLKSLYISSNICVNKDTADNPTEVQNIIKIIKSHCTNSDFSNLLQNVKNLEIESKNLNLEKFKEKLENLEIDVKNSKFENFVQDKLQGLKAVQVDKEKQEELQKMIFWFQNSTKFEALESKIDSLMTQSSNGTDCGHFTGPNSMSITSTDAHDTSPGSRTTKFNEKVQLFDIKLEVFQENLSNFKTFAYKKIDKMEIENKIFQASIKMALERSIEEVERKIDEKFEKMERKFEEILKASKSVHS